MPDESFEDEAVGLPAGDAHRAESPPVSTGALEPFALSDEPGEYVVEDEDDGALD